MRLSTYFADEGKVFVYNLNDGLVRQMLRGDYVIVYVQSVGGKFPPKDITPTTDRFIRIMPFGQEVQSGVCRTYIRFNDHFRNIRQLLPYPIRKTGPIALENLTALGTNGPLPRPAFIDEAGIRMATDSKACRIITDYDVDTLPKAHDSRMKLLLTNTANIREWGSGISFGMVPNTPDSTGYEFCQVELAAAVGDRVLFVAIKIPDKSNVSSAFLKKQPQSIDMREFVQENFANLNDGHFEVKEYGQPGEENNVNLGLKSHEFYGLGLGEQKSKELFNGYTRQVGRALIEPNRFNIGLFEEWRQLISPRTIDRHLHDLHDMYTQEVLMVTKQMNIPAERFGILNGAEGFMNSRYMSDRSERLSRKLRILCDGQMYVAGRRRDIEYERLVEYNFAMKIGPHLKKGSSGKNPRSGSPDTDSSGSTTPTNSPRVTTEMARLVSENAALTAQNRNLKKMVETLLAESEPKSPGGPEEESKTSEGEEEQVQAVIQHPGKKRQVEFAEDVVRWEAGVETGAAAATDAGADADTDADTDAATDAATDAGAGDDDGAGASTDAGADADTDIATDAGADADSDAGAATDAGSNADANTAANSDVNSGANGEANASAAMDTGAGVAMNDGTDAASSYGIILYDSDDYVTDGEDDVAMDGVADVAMDDGGDVALDDGVILYTGDVVAATTSASVNVSDADSDSDWDTDWNAGYNADSSDDDEEGGVSLTPEPAMTYKPRTLDGQCDAEPSTSSGASSPKKRSQSEISKASTSSEDNSSDNGDDNIHSRGGALDPMPSPKKRKLSPPGDDSAKAGRSEVYQDAPVPWVFRMGGV
ncbi:hypothetical protein VE03_03974 [Pseudogymnoascus sp. 23342-1-I1]|nr:hypothetical protein VE03_03974 [Pseudogymnoascus sp. 23342-1-I1]